MAVNCLLACLSLAIILMHLCSRIAQVHKSYGQQQISLMLKLKLDAVAWLLRQAMGMWCLDCACIETHVMSAVSDECPDWPSKWSYILLGSIGCLSSLCLEIVLAFGHGLLVAFVFGGSGAAFFPLF